MDEPSNVVPNRIKNRVRDEPLSYLGRDSYLTDKYRYGDEINHEPVVSIQKEIDGMARLLCRLAAEESLSGDIHTYLEIYENEVERLRALEQGVISELPVRERTE